MKFSFKNMIILVYGLLCFGPLILGFAYSLLYSLGLIGLVNDGFTIIHWLKLFQSSDAINSILYTFVICVLSLFLIIIFALALSWSYFRNRNDWFYKLLVLPLIFAPLIAAFSWYSVLSPSGLISRICFQVGIIESISQFPRLVNDYYSFGIILTHVFIIFPIFTILFIEISKREGLADLHSNAKTLGSSNLDFLRFIYIPLLILKVRNIILLYAIFLLGTFEVALLLGRSQPRTISIYITEKLTKFNLQDIPLGHSMAVLYLILVFALISILLRKRKVDLI